MGNRLYVGNLSFNATETDLMDLFGQAGTVKDVALIQDRVTGKSRGFAFVTMTTDQEAANAISQLNGKSIEGRTISVSEARPREERPSGGVVAVTAGAVAAVVAATEVAAAVAVMGVVVEAAATVAAAAATAAVAVAAAGAEIAGNVATAAIVVAATSGRSLGSI